MGACRASGCWWLAHPRHRSIVFPSPGAHRGGAFQPIHHPLVDLTRLLQHQEMPDTVDEPGLRTGAGVARNALHLLGGHTVTTVVGAMQIQDRLRSAASPGRCLLVRPLRRSEAGVGATTPV